MDFPNTKLVYINKPDLSNKKVLDIMERYMTFKKRDVITFNDLRYMLEELQDLLNEVQ
jgi:hypothetical protein